MLLCMYYMKTSVPFFILTVGHKNVRLYQGDRTSLQHVDIRGLPADMKQTLGIDEYNSQRSVHTVVRAGRVQGVSAAQYNTRSEDKVMLKEFLRRIDDMIVAYLNQHNHPLILAGVDYVQAIYRTINSYPHLLGQGISGNQDEAKTHDLHHQALAIITSQ